MLIDAAVWNCVLILLKKEEERNQDTADNPPVHEKCLFVECLELTTLPNFEVFFFVKKKKTKTVSSS